jgi:hypothetical protein
MKPGWKTTEFWLTMAGNAMSAVYASGVLDAVPGQWDNRIAGVIGMVLVNMGYQVSRAWVKRGR